jgi:hypothetical protein
MKPPLTEAARRTFAGFEGAPGQALRQYFRGAASCKKLSKKRADSPGTGAACSGRRGRKISIERYADPPVPAPDDVARPTYLRALNDQRETVRNEKRGHNFKRRPRIRDVANRAIDCSAAERYRSGLQYSMPCCYPVFIHWIEMRRESP